MSLTAIIGKKKEQTQGFLEDGRRIPLSILSVDGNTVTQIKNTEKEGYMAIQIGLGSRKKLNKPLSGHVKKAGIEKFPRFFREIKVDAVDGIEIGKDLKANEILKPGDIIRVTGISKGKGYAGVVKRWGFAGGPRTHGQSDRERAPGSIGQTTTPGRVYKGKKMAGRMGNDKVTVRNLLVMNVTDALVSVKGLVPGPIGSLITIEKIGEHKKFNPLFKKQDASAPLEIKTDEDIVGTVEPIDAPKTDEAINAEVVEAQPEEKVVEVKAVEEVVENKPKGEENARS